MKTIYPGRRAGLRAFTLIELLVVIAIISILAAILFPVFAQVREKARETTCVSNMRQIGIGVRSYLQDYDETMPVFNMYNTSPAPRTAGHHGVEDEIDPYIKSSQLFRCPDDAGSPASGGLSYYEKYGSSYRFGHAVFSIVIGPTDTCVDTSCEDDAVVPDAATKLVHDADFQVPADTRMMRDEEFPWFGPSSDPAGAKYGYYSTTAGSNYYQQWHPRGGSMVFEDGHAKFITSEAAFDNIAGSPAGYTYNTPSPNQCWWGCD